MKKILLAKRGDIDALENLENAYMSRLFLENEPLPAYPFEEAVEAKKVRIVLVGNRLSAFLAVSHDVRGSLFPGQSSRPFYDLLERLGNPSAPGLVIERFAYDLERNAQGDLSALFKDFESNMKGSDYYLMLPAKMKGALKIWEGFGFQNLGTNWKEGDGVPYLLYKPFVQAGLCRNIGW